MLSIYKSTQNGLEQVEEISTGCWVSVVDPTNNEIQQLTALGIPHDFITYPLDMDERARSEREDDGTMFILIRIPVKAPENDPEDVPYYTIPLGMILTDQVIITVCKTDTPLMKEFESGRIRGLSTGKRIRFVLRLLLQNATKFLSYLRDAEKATEALEDRLLLSMKNKELLELLKYQKSLVYFTTALKANELLLERLQRTQLFRMYPDDEDLLEDVITENQQAIEMSSIQSSILSGMMDAFASIVSNNLNVVMKFLASVTIVLSLPTIITSFFGMNVKLPFADYNFAWLLIFALSLITVGVVTYIFSKRDWF
ncbi:MAG TPA: magnesium transporter CorA family protein [Bellilinea sp.]|nr:magnesium transporter CorA family protein [Bellilinea sp.]